MASTHLDGHMATSLQPITVWTWLPLNVPGDCFECGHEQVFERETRISKPLGMHIFRMCAVQHRHVSSDAGPKDGLVGRKLEQAKSWPDHSIITCSANRIRRCSNATNARVAGKQCLRGRARYTNNGWLTESIDTIRNCAFSQSRDGVISFDAGNRVLPSVTSPGLSE